MGEIKKTGTKPVISVDGIFGQIEQASGKKVDTTNTRAAAKRLMAAGLGQEQGHVVLAIDCSGSMSGKCILEAKKGGQQFVDEAFGKGYEVGIVKFETTAEIVATLSNDEGGLKKAIQSITLGGGTDMAGGIALARQMLKQAGAQNGVICIVTDGLPNSEAAARTQADSAKLEGHEIMCIGTEMADHLFLQSLASSADLAKMTKKEGLGLAIGHMGSSLKLTHKKKKKKK